MAEEPLSEAKKKKEAEQKLGSSQEQGGRGFVSEVSWHMQEARKLIG